MNKPLITVVLFLILTFIGISSFSQDDTRRIKVIAYYHGNTEDIIQYPIEKVTHVIYSFLHLNGNRLSDNTQDSINIIRLVDLKKQYPGLKIILSLGGWGGCPTCSDVFSTEPGRLEFAESVKAILIKYRADGLDLDWEYPAIESVPGFVYSQADKPNFSLLIHTLRKCLGPDYEISFAAGAFTEFLEKSIEWDSIITEIDYINLMTYDYVNGYSKSTGHLTPLYNSGPQQESTDRTVSYLDSIGVPRSKMVIGAAFYARLFSDADSTNHGLFRPARFSGYVNYKDFENRLGPDQGYEQYFDGSAKASYSYNRSTRTFATFDDPISVAEKTKYVLEKGLGGIMFWSLAGDKTSHGLLDCIDQVIKERK